jgi:hypothetical protein
VLVGASVGEGDATPVGVGILGAAVSVGAAVAVAVATGVAAEFESSSPPQPASIRTIAGMVTRSVACPWARPPLESRRIDLENDLTETDGRCAPLIGTVPP